MDQARLHRRRSIRLKGYNYSQAGAYFVTVCTHRRACVLGDVAESQVTLSPTGLIVATCWQDIPWHFAAASLDAWVIMPNHLHGIIIMLDVGAQHAAPLPTDTAHMTKTAPLSVVIRSFKSAVTKQTNEIHATNTPIWQRNYYEHVIRDERGQDRIRQYIADNPARWADDADNPTNWQDR